MPSPDPHTADLVDADPDRRTQPRPAEPMPAGDREAVPLEQLRAGRSEAAFLADSLRIEAAHLLEVRGVPEEPQHLWHTMTGTAMRLQRWADALDALA